MPMKPAPNFEPAKIVPQDGANVIERSFRFLTYVFGGGVEVNGPEKPHDPVTPIRVASIRGQLRFWWRACNPGRAPDVAALREREAEIWGSCSKPSAVTIAVIQQPDGHTPVKVYGPDKKGRWVPLTDHLEMAYGAFPLKPGERDRGRTPGTLSSFRQPDFTVSVRIVNRHLEGRGVSVDEARAGIEEALTAWSLFGGLGGRTRRGFGAIERCDNISTTDAARNFLSELKGRVTPDGVPSLIGATLTLAPGRASAVEAWTRALGLLQSFRQGKSIGRGSGQGPRPGRSFWPEAEEIRRQTGSRAPKHEPLNSHVRRFPRAAFGLPIIFHFHPGTGDDPGSRGDPSDETLKPVKLNRFASPLILRPIREEQHFVAIALRLTGTTVPDRLELSPSPRCPADVRSRLTRDEARTIRPMSSGDTGDVIEAFLGHFDQSKKNRRQQ